MRVVFDSQAFRLERRGGISRYIAWLAQALVEQHVDVHLVAPIHRNANLQAVPSIPQTSRYFEEPIIHRRVDNAINSLIEPVALRMTHPDILHATFYEDRRSAGERARVLTVHDMIHEHFAHMNPRHPLIAMKARAVERADHVICISKTTQRELCEILNVPESKTSVIYHGACRLPMPDPRSSIATETEPYVLFVGQRHPHKNFQILLEAFRASAILQKEFRLVAFGGSPLTAQELDHARRCGLGADRLTQMVGNDELLALYYSRATALVYPSLYEGFGFPLLEAMALGCPVVTTNVSCMPEIAGDAALYFSPDDAQGLAALIESLHSDKILRARLIAAGARRETRFTWTQCARETMVAYEAALAAK